MKKQILPSITLVLALSIMPMTALHAMNEQENNNENQSYLQKAVNYVNEVGYGTIAYNVASFAAGVGVACFASAAMHEGGHALMAEAILPGSVKKIEIFSLTPRVVWIGTANPRSRMAITAAGPIAGSAGSYACAKGLQLLCAYQKTGNFKKAVKETGNMPMYATPSESPFIKGLQLGLGMLSIAQGSQMLVEEDKSDGHRFLSQALYGKDTKELPLSVTLPWNITLKAGMFMATYRSADQFFDYNPEQSNNIAVTIDCGK